MQMLCVDESGVLPPLNDASLSKLNPAKRRSHGVICIYHRIDNVCTISHLLPHFKNAIRKTNRCYK